MQTGRDGRVGAGTDRMQEEGEASHSAGRTVQHTATPSPPTAWPKTGGRSQRSLWYTTRTAVQTAGAGACSRSREQGPHLLRQNLGSVQVLGHLAQQLGASATRRSTRRTRY